MSYLVCQGSLRLRSQSAVVSRDFSPHCVNQVLRDYCDWLSERRVAAPVATNGWRGQRPVPLHGLPLDNAIMAL
jgi:hypothetical protein